SRVFDPSRSSAGPSQGSWVWERQAGCPKRHRGRPCQESPRGNRRSAECKLNKKHLSSKAAKARPLATCARQQKKGVESCACVRSQQTVAPRRARGGSQARLPNLLLGGAGAPPTPGGVRPAHRLHAG